MKVLRVLPLLICFTAASALAQDDGAPATEPPPLPPGEYSDAPAAHPPASVEYSEAPADDTPAELAPAEPPPTEPAPVEPAPTVTAPTTIVVPAAPRVMGRAAPGAVEVGTLGNTEGPVAGTLSDATGGLGSGEWNGVARSAAVQALSALPPATSPTARLLLRRLLLTTAPPPAGQADQPFNAVRIRALLNAGLLADAGAIAAQVRAPKDAETSRAQADALLFAGDDTNGCGDATAHRFESDEQFWIELRAYCYALAKDPALDLTRSVLGTSDPAFNALLDSVITGRPRATVAFANPTALHVRLMRQLKLPLNAAVANLGTPGAFITAQSAATPKAVRLAGAEKAMLAGALAPATIAQVADLAAFKPADLAAAATMARSDPPLMAVARLRAALRTETAPARRAELIYTAFRIGEERGLAYQIAPVFADDAATLELQPTLWANWIPTFVRAFAVSGKSDAAKAWLNAAHGIDMPTSAGDLAIALAIALRDDASIQNAQGALANVAALSVADPEGSSARAALALGLFDALALPMPPEAQARVAPLMGSQWPGRRPSGDALRRIEAAATANRRGEVVLGVLTVMGHGAGDLAPDVVVRLVRALQTAGVANGAHALAAEAVLTR